MDLTKLTAYEIIEHRPLPDLKSEGALLRHKKSGARVLLISNDDENKVFNIGFRTPTTNSTGVPHIMEHTVLCGSEKFPTKDPFCGTGKRIFEHLFECDDLSGQDSISGCKL